MRDKGGSNAASGVSELVLTRVFNAPREVVWRAWTEPYHMMNWWGPKHFTAPSCKIDLKIGGKYHCCMRSPEGKDFWSTGVFRAIDESERLVMTDSFADADGNIVPATYYGMGSEFPLEMLITVTFDEYKDLFTDGSRETRLTVRHAGTQTVPPQHLKDMKQGWNEMLDKLVEYLESR